MKWSLIFLSILFCSPYVFADHLTLRNDEFNPNPINPSGQPTASFGTQMREALDHEGAQTRGRTHAPFVHSGGLPANTAAGLTTTAFATEAFVPERVNQTSTAIIFSTAINDTCWVIISSDNDGIASWTRVGTTAYYYFCEGDTTPTRPTLPANSAFLFYASITGCPTCAITNVVAQMSGVSTLHTRSINVRDPVFGAVGDGTPGGAGTDDTVAFQNALEAVPRGGTLFIPPAEWGRCYRITSTLTVTTDAIQIRGAGWQFAQGDSWILDGSVICQTGAGNRVFDFGDGALEIDGLVVENLAIGGVAGTSDAIRTRTVNRSIFRNLYIVGAGAVGFNQAGGSNFGILNYFENIILSTAFGIVQGYARPTTAVVAVGGPSTWVNLRISGFNGVGETCLDLRGGSGQTFTGGSLESCTVGLLVDNGTTGNLFLNIYQEGITTQVSGSVTTANNRTNLAIGYTFATPLILTNDVGVTIRTVAGRLQQDNQDASMAFNPPVSPFNAAGTSYGSAHVSRIGVATTYSNQNESDVPLFVHTDTDLAGVVTGQFHATGASADNTLVIAHTGNAAVLSSWRRSTGIRTPIILNPEGGMVQLGGTVFTSLGIPGNGMLAFCSDCTIANPCAGGGTGAFAKRLNGVWVCN